VNVFLLVFPNGGTPYFFHYMAVELNIGFTGIKQDPVAVKSDHLQIAYLRKKSLTCPIATPSIRGLTVRGAAAPFRKFGHSRSSMKLSWIVAFTCR
jgi:hypothetical protein